MAQSTSTSSWQPEQGPLRQLVGYLADSLSGKDKTAQKKAELALKDAKQSPDIDNYLSFLLSNAEPSTTSEWGQEKLHPVRLAAGIMLKNDIKNRYDSIPENTRNYIKASIIHGLYDENTQIRSFSGNVITEIVRQGGIMDWPGVLNDLFSMVSNSSGKIPDYTQAGAMGALLKVCEDNSESLNKTYGTEVPLNFIIPKLVELTGSPIDKVRGDAIASLCVFFQDKPEPLMKNLDNLVNRIFELANDSSDLVRKQICRAIVQIVEVSPNKIAPHMEGLVDYMITQQRNVHDPELAQDAAEFWLCVGEDEHLRQALGPYLPKIIPVLLESMVYNEDDVMRLEQEAEDAELEDREQDIKPQFATTKSARSGAAAAAAAAANGSAAAAANGQFSAPNADEDDLSEGELEEYDDEDEEDDPEEAWNLRKCSAASLDTLASVFHQPVFETTLPYLKANLNHAEWPNREAAVLAIGAIADGCMEAVKPHLPDLVPYLISLLQDDQPVVRQITCWSLGRYATWAAHLDAAGKQQFFLPMMDGILKRMLDGNKRVQEAAVSAFANLEEKSGRELENPEYCLVIAKVFAECFSKYKDKNMFILYDAVQTLAEHVGSTLQSPELVHSLMPAILKRWEKVSDSSIEMFPLLECLSYIAMALGNTFSPYAQPIFSRCNQLIYEKLQESRSARDNPALDDPPKDFLITSLDLMSAIIQALGSEPSIELVKQCQPNMFDLIGVCLQDESLDVRQSAYALLGDCAIYVFSELRSRLPNLMPILIAELDLSSASAQLLQDTNYAVTNNACWSCGEITLQAGQEMAPFAETLLQRFYAILTSFQAPPSLRENSAVALGRLCGGCSDMLAPHLSLFAPMVLLALSAVEWTDEKSSALKGLADAIAINPQGLEQCLLQFVAEVAKPTRVQGEPVFDSFEKVLLIYKTNIPTFEAMVQQQLGADVEKRLKQMYSL